MGKIILASASPRRKELLTKAHVRFEILPAKGEESITEKDPEEVVRCLAGAKAQEVAGCVRPDEDTLVLGADTIVVYEGIILGKPVDEEDALRMLTMLQGRTHQVYTGVAWQYYKEGIWMEYSFAECTDVLFYPVTEEEILSYIKTGEPMDKAGAYGIQGEWGIHVKGIRGDYNNVVGLPVARLFHEAKKAGITLR